MELSILTLALSPFLQHMRRLQLGGGWRERDLGQQATSHFNIAIKFGFDFCAYIFPRGITCCGVMSGVLSMNSWVMSGQES